MSMGPTIIYDKSALQMLSLDQAQWLAAHYTTNLCPLLYVEVLADLEKAPPEDRTADEVVRDLAKKVNSLGTHPNVDHWTLVLGEMLGTPVPMQRLPIKGGGRQVVVADGRTAIAFDEPPEMVDFNRWKRADFVSHERDLARQWRDMLARVDLKAMADEMLAGRELRFTDLAAVKRFADHMVRPKNGRYQLLRYAMEILGVPAAVRPAIVRRWKDCGGPSLWEFAPYSHFVLTVDAFFMLAVASGHIAANRPSNKVDMAYFYYLPFCMVFTSNDKLHKRTVPLFLADDQVFVPAADLKADLAKLADYYAVLPEDVKQQGRLTYAAYPPLQGDYLTCRLHDRFFPGWREHAANPIKLTPEMEADIIRKLTPMMDAFDGRQPTDSSAPVEGAEVRHILKVSAHNDSNRRKLF
jgi:hypothetical protein